jgi:hypothetical protein
MAEREEKPIRVVDRRMFTPEGDLRPDFEAEEEKPTSAPPPPPRPAEAPPRPASERPPAGAEPRTQFASFVEFLAINVSSALQHGNPRVAQQMIDWLGMLEQKTRGNLSFEESNFLSGVLYELRLAFVEVSRPAPKK